MFWRRKTVSMVNCDVYGDDDIYDEVYGDDDNLEDVGLRSWTVAGLDPSGVDAQPPMQYNTNPLNSTNTDGNTHKELYLSSSRQTAVL